MLKRNSVFDFLSQVFLIFGITILCLAVFCVLFGADAKSYSSMFSLGKAGISVDTLLQFLLISVIITVLKWIFFTDLLFKQWSLMVRTIVMFLLVILTMVICIVIFDWFPVNMLEPWLMFFLCFFISAAVSVGVSTFKEKSENKKMQEALERLREGEM